MRVGQRQGLGSGDELGGITPGSGAGEERWPLDDVRVLVDLVGGELLGRLHLAVRAEHLRHQAGSAVGARGSRGPRRPRQDQPENTQGRDRGPAGQPSPPGVRCPAGRGTLGAASGSSRHRSVTRWICVVPAVITPELPYFIWILQVPRPSLQVSE